MIVGIWVFAPGCRSPCVSTRGCAAIVVLVDVVAKAARISVIIVVVAIIVARS